MQLKYHSKIVHHLLNVSQKVLEQQHDAEDLNLVMTMFDLLECSSNYSGTTGSLWLQLMVMLIFRTLKLLKLLSIDLSD